MKSANKAGSFSIDDFEKGLMLAGLISPSTINELNERTELEMYEKELLKENGKQYFKRVVLAAEVASELYNEPTFGRIKFQKVVYMCEYAVSMQLESRYSKQVAGPFDNKFMHTIEKEFKKLNWFDVQKKTDGKITRSTYIPLSGKEEYRKYYNSYFSSYLENIKYVIDLFRKFKTDDTEIAATVFACCKEINNKNEPFSEDTLLNLFYSWSEKKKRFEKKRVLDSYEWLKEKGLINK